MTWLDKKGILWVALPLRAAILKSQIVSNQLHLSLDWKMGGSESYPALPCNLVWGPTAKTGHCRHRDNFLHHWELLQDT